MLPFMDFPKLTKSLPQMREGKGKFLFPAGCGTFLSDGLAGSEDFGSDIKRMCGPYMCHMARQASFPALSDLRSGKQAVIP